jgi:hypothetical protein
MINRLRSDPSDYKKYLKTRYAERELNKWESAGNYPDFEWSEALAMAARQVISNEAPCQIDGDHNGNYISEVLRKYFAYAYTDLEILKVTAPDLTWNSTQAIEFILAQDCIDKSIFKTKSVNFGIACSCETNEFEEMSCYFVAAREIRPKKVIEQIPNYQVMITGGDTPHTCAEYCRFTANWMDSPHGSQSWFYSTAQLWTPDNTCPMNDMIWENDCFDKNEDDFSCSVSNL